MGPPGQMQPIGPQMGPPLPPPLPPMGGGGQPQNMMGAGGQMMGGGQHMMGGGQHMMGGQHHMMGGRGQQSNMMDPAQNNSPLQFNMDKGKPPMPISGEKMSPPMNGGGGYGNRQRNDSQGDRGGKNRSQLKHYSTFFCGFTANICEL